MLRYGIPYGPRARDGAVIPIFVGKALRGEPLTIAGDGSQFRQFVYVEDLAEGNVMALKPVAAHKIYNLDGLTGYSSDPSEIGEDKTNNPGFFSAARVGKAVSRLTFRDTVSVFEGTVKDGCDGESQLTNSQA